MMKFLILILLSGFSNANKTWLPVHENYVNVNLLLQKYIDDSHYHVYRALTQLRNTSNALKFGSLTTDVVNNTILYILRKTSQEAVTLLINFSDKEKQEIDLTKVLTGFKNGKVKVASVGFGIKQK